MSKIKLILPACFIAFFACSCSEKVTGTTEDENTVIAQGESSSSEVVGEPEPGRLCFMDMCMIRWIKDYWNSFNRLREVRCEEKHQYHVTC